MKIFSKIVLGLFLSAQAFSAPLEERQSMGTITTADAAVNRLLSRILAEVYSLSMVTIILTIAMHSNALYDRHRSPWTGYIQSPGHGASRQQRPSQRGQQPE